ncbi:uncharacterized protein [Hetaerina americana]|uniref:uncharacterized protein n=1 Tax=Hetaerina americana TaxID=62018 RepID=UPI003A7F60D0
MVERAHRQLKAAIRCHSTDSWVDVLPSVLLGLRAAWKEDLGATAADLVYGASLRLPGEFLSPSPETHPEDPTSFVTQLRAHIRKLSPHPASRHGGRRTFVFQDLPTASQVFVRNDAVRGALQPPYDGPFAVLQRGEKNFLLRRGNRDVRVAIDRLKPAYVAADDPERTPPMGETQGAPPAAEERGAPEVAPKEDGRKTRAGRHVHFPQHLQDFVH